MNGVEARKTLHFHKEIFCVWCGYVVMDMVK